MNGIVPPVPLETPPIEVPPELIGSGLSGAVKLSCVIDHLGRTGEFKLLEGINDQVDQLTIAVIRDTWKFQPGSLNGEAVKIRYNIAIPFNLSPPDQVPATETEE